MPKIYKGHICYTKTEVKKNLRRHVLEEAEILGQNLRKRNYHQELTNA